MNKIVKRAIIALLLIVTVFASSIQCFAGVVQEIESVSKIQVPGGIITCAVKKTPGVMGKFKRVWIISATEGVTEFKNFFTNKEGAEKGISPTAFEGCTKLKFVDLYGYDGGITAGTFNNCVGLEKIVIYPETTAIVYPNFEGCDKLVIYCKDGSTAQKYAEKYGIKYRLITQTPYNEIEDEVFNADVYRANNQDVVSALGNDDNVLYNHWIRYGIKEGRKGSKIFDPKYYIEHNEQVQKECGNDYMKAYEHYITTGYNKGFEAIAKNVYGDVTGNSKLETDDVNYLLEYVLSPAKAKYTDRIKSNVELFDVNSDNVINTEDVSMLLQKVINSNYQFKK